MAKDSLAQGARSATFLAPNSKRGEEIEIHSGMVALEEPQQIACEHGVSGSCILCDRAIVPQPKPKSLEELAAKYEPMNDRVLLRRITEENKRLVNLPDAFVMESDIGVVIAVGLGANVYLDRGDKVRYGHYNAEEIEVEGEKLILVSACDIRLKIKA